MMKGSRASAESPRRQSETFDSDDEPAAVPDFAYELLASIVAGLAWRKGSPSSWRPL